LKLPRESEPLRPPKQQAARHPAQAIVQLTLRPKLQPEFGIMMIKRQGGMEI